MDVLDWLAVDGPRRPVLRYFGAKWRIAPWIISYFPPHICYVEPCQGAASVLFRKRPSPFEYLNDSDREVHNLFRVFRERGPELVAAIEATPFSRHEFTLSYEPAEDPVEKARRLYVRCWQGRSGARRNRTGWRHQVRPARNKTALRDFTDASHLPAVIERLREVGLECDDVLAVLRRYDSPDTLFYVDPPYLREVRASYERYPEEFDTEHEHRILGAVLCELEGMVILSGKRCDVYADLFESRGWARHDRDTRDNAGPAIESIWINPACAAAKRVQGQKVLRFDVSSDHGVDAAAPSTEPRKTGDREKRRQEGDA